MNKAEIYAVLHEKYLSEGAPVENMEAFSDIFHTACTGIVTVECIRVLTTAQYHVTISAPHRNKILRSGERSMNGEQRKSERL